MTSCSWYQGTPTRYALDAIVGDYASSLSTVNIKNMAIVNNSGQNLTIHGGYSSADINQWYSYDIDGSTYTNIVTTNGNITNSTNADAMYLDPATNDFRLKPTQPSHRPRYNHLMALLNNTTFSLKFLRGPPVSLLARTTTTVSRPYYATDSQQFYIHDIWLQTPRLKTNQHLC